MGQWVGAQGRPKVAKISKRCLLCDVTSRKPPPKTKNVFFRCQLEGLLNLQRVWTAL